MQRFLALALVVASLHAQDPPAPPVVVEPEVEPTELPPVPVEVPGQPAAWAHVPLPFHTWTLVADARLRAGPSDTHAVWRILGFRAPLRLVAREGEWFQVEVPGASEAYVSAGEGGKEYVATAEDGSGTVRVTNLMVRAGPGKEHAILGRLQPGDRVTVLGTEGAFLRILPPGTVGAWVWSGHVDLGADAVQAEKLFAEAARSAAEARQRDLAERRRREEAAARERARREQARVVFDRYREEAARPLAERDLDGLASALEGLRRELPAGSAESARAETILASVRDWQRARRELGEASARISEIRKEAEAVQADYRRELQEILERRQRIEQEGRRPDGKPLYLATGWVRRSLLPGVPEAPNVTAPFALYQASDTRRFILESERYRLADYVDKLVGIVEAEGPIERPGQPFRVLKVQKLEIIEHRVPATER
jgi:hypothetical protein